MGGGISELISTAGAVAALAAGVVPALAGEAGQSVHNHDLTCYS